MSKKSDLIKKIVKTNVAPKATFGTDPKDPWSTKANITEESINETPLLNRYLKSRGINPEFVSKDTKVAHSKTNEFKVWMQAHQNDPIREDAVEESMTMQHTPTEKRLHALKRSMHMHKEIRTTNAHKDLHSVKEDVEKLDEVSDKTLQSYRSKAHTQIQHYKFGSGKDKPEASLVLSKREPGMKRATDKVIKKDKDRIAALPKREPQKLQTYKPLGGRDEVSGRSYSEEFEHIIDSLFEGVDKKDTVTMDIPLLIRVLELAREDLKSDADLHRVVEKLIEIRSKGILTMDDYDTVAQIKEQVEQLSEISKDLARNYMWSAISDRNKKDEKIRTAIDKNRKEFSPRRHKNIGKMLHQTQKRGEGILRAIDRVQKEEVEQIDELKASTYTSYLDKVTDPKIASTRGKTQTGTLKSIKAIGGVAKAIGKRAKAQSKEMMGETLEPMAACNQPGDGANNPDDTIPSRRKEMSKSARIIKSIYKKKGVVKEEMYDHEKEDKSTAPLGKKPKLNTPGQDSVTKETPQAAAVLSGGKTLTGEPRDTIEIDPMMKMRKSSPDSQKTV